MSELPLMKPSRGSVFDISNRCAVSFPTGPGSLRQGHALIKQQSVTARVLKKPRSPDPAGRKTVSLKGPASAPRV